MPFNALSSTHFQTVNIASKKVECNLSGILLGASPRCKICSMCFLDLTSGGGASYNQPSSVTSSSSITIGCLYVGAGFWLVVALAGLAAWAALGGWAALVALFGVGVVVGCGTTTFLGFLAGIWNSSNQFSVLFFGVNLLKPFWCKLLQYWCNSWSNKYW